jgi:hypothetical protein
MKYSKQTSAKNWQMQVVLASTLLPLTSVIYGNLPSQVDISLRVLNSCLSSGKCLEITWWPFSQHTAANDAFYFGG